MSGNTNELPSYALQALCASRAGTWETDFAIDMTFCDAIISDMFGFDPQEAAAGLPLSRYVNAIHPDDRALFAETVERVIRTGGLFAAEYRTQPRVGQFRWVMARGRYEIDPKTGCLYGRGIAIDISESKSDDYANDRFIYLPTLTRHCPLEQAAEHTLEARTALDQAHGFDVKLAKEGLNNVLWMLGKHLARAIRFRN